MAGLDTEGCQGGACWPSNVMNSLDEVWNIPRGP
jgi:hypothetical protein